MHGANIYGKPAGYSWLELTPHTGRKHQVKITAPCSILWKSSFSLPAYSFILFLVYKIRVHCAEVLGTPIVGDYKYGWQAHKKHFPLFDHEQNLMENPIKRRTLPFGLDLEHGSISEKQPQLHLHCKEMILPDVSAALDRAQRYSIRDLSNIPSLKLDAPLPFHMQRSWDILYSWARIIYCLRSFWGGTKVFYSFLFHL